MAEAPERAPADAARFREALIVSGLLSIGLVLFYAVLFPIEGIRVPAWSDAQTYIWWARRAGALGLSAFGTGTRPATVGLVATLSTLVHVPAEAVVEVIGIVLAAALGLAAAALSESLFGPHRGRLVLVAVLTGTFVSQLATSFFATLAFAAVFVAGMAYLSEGLGTRRRTLFAVAGVLFGIAALAHPVFGGLEGVLVIGGLVVLAVWPPGRSVDDGHEPKHGARAWVGWALTGALAVGVFGLGLLVARSGSGPPIDVSADAVLRRLGLNSLYRKTYRDTLLAYLPVFLPTLAAAGVALALIPRRRWASTAARRRMFGGIAALWGALTLVAIPVLLLGLRVPAQRLVALCLPLPVVIAAGIVSDSGSERRRGRPAVVAGWVAVIGAVAFLVPRYWVAWEAQKPNSPEAVAVSRTLGSVMARQGGGVPLILVANDTRDLPSFFHVTRLANYLRDAVPPARVPHVHVFLGTPQDLMAGRPTLTGKPARDRMALDYWNRIRAYDRHGGRLAVVVEAFDPVAYREVLAMPRNWVIGPGVVAVPGFLGGVPTGNPRAPPIPTAYTSVGAGPLSPWLPMWLGPLLVLALGAIGWPWVAGTLRGASPRIRAGLAPAVGIATLSLAVIAADALGLRLDGSGAYVAFVVAAGGGLLLLVGLGRHRPGPASADRDVPRESPMPSSLRA
jgi:hypothetical protein